MTLALSLILLVVTSVNCTLLVTLLRMLKGLSFTALSLDPTVSAEIVESLDRAADLARAVASELEINVAEARQQFSRLVILLDRLQMDVTAGGEADERSAVAAAKVATNLEASQKQARDEMGSGWPPGAVADSSASGAHPPKPKPRARKQT